MEKSLSDLQQLIEMDVKEYSPLTLAFLGDSVYELYVRTHLVKSTNAPPDVLHRRTVQFVKASAQCAAYDKILPLLTEAEITVFKRGRNAKTNSKAKNAGLAEYKKATGFETLMGHLFVTKQNNRLMELMKAALEI